MWRPLSSIGKSEIRDFAKRQNVPHLKDNDYPGAKRIVWRQRVLPSLQAEFGDKALANIAGLGSRSLQWKKVVDKFILHPFWQRITFADHGAVVPLVEHADSPAAFWEEALSYVFHSLGTVMMSSGALNSLVAALSLGESCVLFLHTKYAIVLDGSARMVLLPRSMVAAARSALKMRRAFQIWADATPGEGHEEFHR